MKNFWYFWDSKWPSQEWKPVFLTWTHWFFLHQHGKAHSQPRPQCSLCGKQPQTAPGVRNAYRWGTCRSCGCPPGCLNCELIKTRGTFLFLKPIHSRAGAESLLQKHLSSPLSPLVKNILHFVGLTLWDVRALAYVLPYPHCTFEWQVLVP